MSNEQVIETLLRFGVTGINVANERIAGIGAYTQVRGRKNKAALTSAQDHLTKAVAALYRWAESNDITLRESMKT